MRPPTTRSKLSLSLSLSAVLTLSSSTLEAQALGARRDFIFHVNVDPLHGDDILAGGDATVPPPVGPLPTQNPVGGTGIGTPNQALQRHPYLSGSVIKGYLQHAPHPFRTVTAALAYVKAQFIILPLVSPTLPWKYPGSSSLQISRVVIHCLPGLYGPYTESLNDRIDPRSGLPYNGETFPLVIPQGVSIQGASALDTIFDGRGRDGYYNFVFEYNDPTFNTSATFVDDFLDSVTVRGARSSGQHAPPFGAGIAVTGESKVQVVISNCFITDNHVGIAINSYYPYGRTYYHSPVIVNNTIAWNQIGIWSGMLKVYPGGIPLAKLGWARPRVYNNILDSGDPDAQFVTTSCFEGLDPTDLTIHKIGAAVVDIDFNAYEGPQVGYYNIGISAYPPGWNSGTYQTGPRSTSPVYKPRVDILPYTQTKISAKPRKALYVNDTFRISMGAPNNFTSLSPHDFRLTIHPRATLIGPLILNPLVNQGVDTSAGALDFANNLLATPTPVITLEPGLKSPGSQTSGSMADYSIFHSGDWDGEGYGNLRTEVRPDFPVPSPNSTYRDIGADEMAAGIMIAGTVPGTRTFSRLIPIPGGTSTSANDKIYFFQNANVGTFPRPNFVSWTGQSWDSTVATPLWYEYVQMPKGTNIQLPNMPAGYTVFNPPTLPSPRKSYYTNGQAASDRWLRTLTNGWTPFVKSLECDYTPGLLPEIHPLWGSWIFNDAFGGNSWYGDNSSLVIHTPTGYLRNNPYFYYDPATGYAVLYGTTNPPGSHSFNGNTGYLLLSQGTQFGPYGYAGTSTYTVNAWGYGDIAGPDVVPDTNWLGVRVCAQVFAWDSQSQVWIPKENLQSFLMINGVDIAPPGKQSSSQGFVSAKPTKKQMSQLVEKGRAEIIRRFKSGK